MKSKPFFISSLYLIFTAFLVSCGGGAPGELQVKIMFPSGGLGDRSFSDMVYTGVIRAEQKESFEKVQFVPADALDADNTIREWFLEPARNPELIITIGQLYTGTLKSIGCPEGARYLLHLDDTLPDCSNTISVNYRTYAPSFLAGVASMTVSKRKTAAVIGGMNLPAVNEFIRGFTAGVEYAGGTVVSTEYLAGDESGFNMPDKAKERAEILFSAADVVFPLAGASGLGVFEAAKAATGRFSIGVDSDQAWIGRNVIIGSVIKRLDKSAEDAIVAFLSGKFMGGALTPGLDDGGTEFVVNEVFSGQVADAVNAARQAALEAERKDRELPQ